jgi:hypothetical protein
MICAKNNIFTMKIMRVQIKWLACPKVMCGTPTDFRLQRQAVEIHRNSGMRLRNAARTIMLTFMICL